MMKRTRCCTFAVLLLSLSCPSVVVVVAIVALDVVVVVVVAAMVVVAVAVVEVVAVMMSWRCHTTVTPISRKQPDTVYI